MCSFKEYENKINNNIWKELDQLCSGEIYFNNNQKDEKSSDIFESFDAGKEEKNSKEQISHEQIIKETLNRAEKIEQEAYERGFHQGEKDGYEMGKQRARKVAEQLSNILESFDNIKDSLLKYHEGDIISLIYRISEKIIGKKIESNDYDLKNIIYKVIENLSDKNKIIIRINSDDYELLKETLPEIEKKISGLKSINIVSDNSVQKGGCVVETPYETIDASINARLNNIKECIERAYRGIY